MIFRYGPLCLLAFLSSVGIPAQATGQSIVRTGGGVTFGLTPNLAEAFSHDQICPKRSGVSVSARMTVALTGVIQLEALAEEFNGPRSDCVSGHVPPIPLSGQYTQAFDYYDPHITDPPTVIALRVGGWFPTTPKVALRPYAGIGQRPGKGITIPHAGLSILAGGSPLRLLLEIEGWWYSVPKQHLEEEYFDGRLIRRTLTEHGVRNITTIFRIGFASIVGSS